MELQGQLLRKDLSCGRIAKTGREPSNRLTQRWIHDLVPAESANGSVVTAFVLSDPEGPEASSDGIAAWVTSSRPLVTQG